MQIKSCLPFSNSNPQFKTEQHNHIWIADAHRDDGKRFVVHADEKLTAIWNWEWQSEVAANCLALSGASRRATGGLALELD